MQAIPGETTKMSAKEHKRNPKTLKSSNKRNSAFSFFALKFLLYSEIRYTFFCNMYPKQ